MTRPDPEAAPKRPSLFGSLDQPLTVRDVEAGLRGLGRRGARILSLLSVPLFLAVLIYATADALSHRVPYVLARHRAESLAFQLVSPPRLQPPMEVTVSAALVRGRLAASAPPDLALRQIMHFDESMVLDRQQRHVGDFAVSSVWLRLPGEQAHWLVTGWMEGGDLAVLNLRFDAEGPELGALEREWGERLLGRVLTEANFHAAGFPPARIQPQAHGSPLPVLGARGAGDHGRS